MVISPCISFKTDPVTGFCYGCGRNNEEKKNNWKNENTTLNGRKKKIIEIKNPIKRLAIRKFNTEESYKHKIENGISLLKKEMLK